MRQRGRSIRSGLLIALELVLLGSACAPATQPPAPVAARVSAPDAPAPAAPFKVRAATTAITAAMLPLWVAYDAGFLAAEGIELELLGFPSGNEGIQAMVAGEIDFTQSAAASTVSAALQGADAVVLTTPLRTIIAALMARPEIVRAEELRGRALGITRRGTSIDSAGRLALRHFGLQPDQDVAITQSGSQTNILGAMEAGRVQAGILSYPTATLGRRLGFRELLDIGELDMPYAFAGINSRRGYVAQHADAVLRYVRAQTAAIHHLKTDKAFALETTRKYLQVDDPDVLEESYQVYVVKYLVPVPYPDEATMRGVLDELATEIPAARDANPRDLFDDRFVRQLDESGYIRSLSR